jgi:hypothetical protein
VLAVKALIVVWPSLPMRQKPMRQRRHLLLHLPQRQLPQALLQLLLQRLLLQNQ